MKKSFLLVFLLTISCVSNKPTKVVFKPTIMVSSSPSVVITLATPILTPTPQVSQVVGTPSPTPIPRHTVYATIHIPTPLPTAIQSTSNPNGTDYGGSGDIVDNVLLAGYIYDEDGKILEKAKVSLEFIYLAIDLYNVITDSESDSKGFYAIGDFKDGTKVKITVSKEGYQYVSRIETLKAEHLIDPQKKYINFGGKGDDAKYALKKMKTS